jgi:hypothetical protein
MSRIKRGARHAAEHALAKLGYTPEQTERVITDAREMADLEWLATED